MNKAIIYAVLISVVLGAIFGSVAAYVVTSKLKSSNEELIKEFYLTENAAIISPHSLRVRMDKGINDYTLVDLRSQEEYEKEHIIGAVNIPAYKNKSTAAYEEKERIIGEFSKLSKDKEIIVYCYSMPCMTGRKIGKMLAENDIYVKHLGIGWNEWRHYWNLWNHEYEWSITNVSNYIAAGKEPGTPEIRNITSVCDAESGC